MHFMEVIPDVRLFNFPLGILGSLKEVYVMVGNATDRAEGFGYQYNVLHGMLIVYRE